MYWKAFVDAWPLLQNQRRECLFKNPESEKNLEEIDRVLFRNPK
jgi:hypothetical protein